MRLRACAAFSARSSGPSYRAGAAARASAIAATVRLKRNGDVGGRGHIVDAQQVEAGQQTAEHGPGDVAAVKKAKPRHPLWPALDPARIAGSVAPISSVGGSKHAPATAPRSRMPGTRGRHNACRPLRHTACRTTPPAR